MSQRLSVLFLSLTLPALVYASPQEGEMHPNVRLPTIDGKRTIALSELRGQKVLLIEFASW